MAHNKPRKYPRVNISFPVECNILPKRSYFYTVSKDLSLGGLKIINNSFISKGSFIRLQLNLIDKVLKLKAKVAWCNRKRASERHFVGLEFVETTDSSKRNLTKFLDKIHLA
jgi:Tfp pilus assembly protein PilZ